ncbi:hypothetical protein Ancab_008471 [Ancistrocladus abbreviatus]
MEGNKKSSSSSNSSREGQSSEEMEMGVELRRGPWTVEEDLNLMNYIAAHGEGRWNSLARCAGLRRTGKSCRLRWLNYLRPDVRRGNITLEEQLLILELHSRWGNRWSKIAQYLPGRTDNEIKNYWRTRVQKHAKQLKCDVNSKQFKDTMRYLWMPRLVERIQAAAAATASSSTTSTTASSTNPAQVLPSQGLNNNNNNIVTNRAQINSNDTPENSNSSDSFTTRVSSVSDPTDYYTLPTNRKNTDQDYFHANQVGHPNSQTGPCGYFNQSTDLQNNQWCIDGDTLDNFWNAEDIYFLQQQLSSSSLM